jgi:hypothetical protein
MGPLCASILYSAKIQHPRDALATYPNFDPNEQFFMNFGVIWQYKMVYRLLFPWF